MKAYIDRDEWYPWYNITSSKSYFDLEVEIEESEYQELLSLQAQVNEFQARLNKLYLQGKKHD